MSILVTLVVGLGRVLQVASVFNGNLVAYHRGSARTFLQDSLSNTHCSCRTREVALRCSCEISGGGSERIGQGKHIKYRERDGSDKIRPKVEELRRGEGHLSYVVASLTRRVLPLPSCSTPCLLLPTQPGVGIYYAAQLGRTRTTWDVTALACPGLVESQYRTHWVL